MTPAGGSVHFSVDDDGNTRLIGDASLEVKLEHVRNVSILNMADVASYTQSTQAGFVSHVVRFHNGGMAEFACNSRGQVISLCARGAGIVLCAGQDVLFTMFY